MKTCFLAFTLAGLCLACPAQTTPPAPSAGLVNDFLRERYPALTNWDFGGQVRVRFEGKSGFAVPGTGLTSVDFSEATPDNTYWLMREKLHLGWTPLSWLTLYGEGRNSVSYNDRRNPEPEEDTIDLHQAWVTLGNPRQFPVTAKVGRQELSYGDERLVGAYDWNNIGRVFDAAKLRYQNDDIWVDAFGGRVVLANDGEFNVANDYDWFSGLYASTRTLVPKQETQLYFLARNTTSQSPTATTGSPQPGGPTARDIYTVGLRFASLPGQFGPWDYNGEIAGQFGDFFDPGLNQFLDQRAFAAHIAAGYTFTQTAMTPRLGLEYNYASGDSDPNDAAHGTFENLFPTNHRFYGYMDFFSWQNMRNARFAGSARPLKDLFVTLDYHLFWLADTSDFFYNVSGAPRATGGYDRAPGNDSFVGSEIDLVATWTIRSFAALQGGYGHFFRGDYVKESLTATGSQDADWVYVQAVVNF